MERGAAFAVGLVDACPSSHQGDGALVAAVGGCVVQRRPGEKWKRRVEESGTDPNAAGAQPRAAS